MEISIEEFKRRLEGGDVISLSPGEWDTLAPSFRETARRATGLAGDIILCEYGGSVLVVENPSPDAVFARLLESPEAAAAFVDKRMEAYERMWDGCGCNVHYDLLEG